MKNNIINILIFSCILLSGSIEAVCANTFSLKSPNSKIEVRIDLEKQVCYSVWHDGQKILDKSNIAMVLNDGNVWGENPKLLSNKKNEKHENIVSPFYRSQSFTVDFNELTLKFKGDYSIVFRVYNEGVAYRFLSQSKKEIVVENEVAEFKFDKDYVTYLAHSTNAKEPFSMAFQNTYSQQSLSKADTTIAFLPATIDLGNQKKMTILESDLENYPGMFVKTMGGDSGLMGVFAHYPSKTDQYPWRRQEYVKERADFIAKIKGARSFPWRILAISEKDIEMPINNLVYALASPNRIGDYSWVKAGKSAWEWWNDWGLYEVGFKAGINMETYMHYIDFASRFGLEYVILDEGWYDPKSGDMMAVIPELDLPKLTEYAKSKGVDLILWTVFNVLDSQLDEVCKHYSQMGIKGFKVDFLDRDDQEAVAMVYRIAEATAQHKLILDLHGIYKPTGINRTYPNIINFEGVFGMEEAKWSTAEKDMPQYDVTFPFIRMMAGPVDFTSGAMRNASKKDFQPIYFNPMSQGTRCHQLATYIVYDSPLTMLCDAPTLYEKEADYTHFLSSIPVEVDETKILDGVMGSYIVTARRKGSDWYVGGLSNWTARNIKIDLSFLDAGKKYKAILFKDGINAEKQGSDYSREVLNVSNSSSLSIKMASGGGFAIQIKEDLGAEKLSSSIPARLNLDSFYKKYVDANGIPVLSSSNVRNEALSRASTIIAQILSKRDDVRKAMIDKNCRVMIIGENEDVCQLPEYAHVCDTPENIDYLNSQARGFGGAPEHEFSASCGEENVLGLRSDRYKGESILVHEFAHIFHTVGILSVDPNFDKTLENLYLKSIKNGLWKDTYAISSKEEYFAETFQSFFNCNSFAASADGIHNSINTRNKLKVYDPEMYHLLLKYLPEVDLDLCSQNKYN